MSMILIDSLSVEACSIFSLDWCSGDVKIKELYKICIQHKTQDKILSRFQENQHYNERLYNAWVVRGMGSVLFQKSLCICHAICRELMDNI